MIRISRQKLGSFSRWSRSVVRNSVHFLGDHDQSSDSFSDTSAQAYALVSKSKTTTITTVHVPIQVIIDSGAYCNVLTTAGSDKSAPLQVTQCLVADVQFHDGPSVSTAFFILPGSQSSPLWRETAETLQLLKIVNQVATPSPPVSNNKNLDNYSGLCERTAKLKNHPVKLHINKFVPPVARKHSQSHFISDTK